MGPPTSGSTSGTKGFPGILHRQNGNWYFKENLGDGRFGPLEVVDEVPAAVSAAFQLKISTATAT